MFRLPDGMNTDASVPLMCCGSTVFNALCIAGVNATSRVGIVGLGGLGHLAVQFAAMMGCHVIVFSGNDSGKEQATKLGATAFYRDEGIEEFHIEKPLDHLILTTSSYPDWNLYVPVLGSGAVISMLIPGDRGFCFPASALQSKGLSLQGHIVATSKVYHDMLEFAALHGIKPVKRTFPLTVKGVEDCSKALRSDEIKYCGVLAVS